MINIKGCSALATALKQEEKTAWLERQPKRVQDWATRYERDKQARIDELAELGRVVANAEVKFASKSQRRALIIQPQAEPRIKAKPQVVLIKSKQARRIRVDPMTEGLSIYKFRWRRIKDILWNKGWNTFIPKAYLFFGSFEDMRNDKIVANDIIFFKKMLCDLELRGVN